MTKPSIEKNPRAFAVCVGMDALRLATGQDLKNFEPGEIVEYLNRAAHRYGKHKDKADAQDH